MACILSELKEIAEASKSRKKYFHLLSALSEMGLIGLSSELEEIMLSENIRGSTKLIGQIDVFSLSRLPNRSDICSTKKRPVIRAERFPVHLLSRVCQLH